MTRLALNIRNELAKDSRIRALVGRDATWTDGWIFTEDIHARLEGTEKCAIVVSEVGTYTTMNAHNTMKFPRIEIDIWADPSRNDDGSVQVHDAKFKIEDIIDIIDQHLHLVDLSAPNGDLIRWGSEADIAAGKASVIAGSSRIEGPDFRDIADTEGGVMGRYAYGINKVK